jgi:hypothetical protein
VKLLKPVFYSSLEQLPFKLYYEVSTTGNYNLLVISGHATTDQCIEAFDNIIRLWEKASGKAQMSFELTKAKDGVSSDMERIGLIAAYYLVRFGESKGIEVANYFGINISDCSQQSINRLKSKLGLIDTKARLKKITTIKTKETGDTFWDILTAMQAAAPELGIKEDINCADYISKVKYIEKKYGRGSKGK